MKIDEFRFMHEKLITIISQTLSFKRSYLSEIYKAVEHKIIPPIFKEKITKAEFLKVLKIVTREVIFNIDEMSKNVGNFTGQIKKSKLPEYLLPENLFLGKYLIKEVLPLAYILDKGLNQNSDTVFTRRNKESQQPKLKNT